MENELNKIEKINFDVIADCQKKGVILLKQIALLIFTMLIFLNIYLPIDRAKKQKLPVLLYHHILPEKNLTDDNAFIISEENFATHMAYLYDNGYTTISLEELNGFLYDKQPLPDKSILITFDDGYYSNIIYAYPILKKFGYKATVFLITETLEQFPPMWPNPANFITKEQMKDTDDIFEYASHTHALHKNTDGKSLLAKADFDAIISDINLSLELVYNKHTFAYPHGQYNDTIIDALKETVIKIAFAITHGYVTQESNPLKLNRFTIYRTTSIEQFKDILLNAEKR
jgi:peptidoglycan/xylan/chitin deacetylase (PgdA/CDA1 family)